MRADVRDVGEADPAAWTRCPRCSAAVRPGAPWCTQCYAPAGTAAGRPCDDRPVAPGGVRLAERAPSVPSTGSWPCGTCSRPNDLALAACEGCGTPFLAAARDPRPTVVLPVVGDLLALSPVRRTALAVVVVVALLLVTALLALLLA